VNISSQVSITIGDGGPLAFRRSKIWRNVNRVNMNQPRFCHTREGGYPGGFSSDLVLDSCLRRNDKQQESRPESTCSRPAFGTPRLQSEGVFSLEGRP
jgi:hypothetical protein